MIAHFWSMIQMQDKYAAVTKICYIRLTNLLFQVNFILLCVVIRLTTIYYLFIIPCYLLFCLLLRFWYLFSSYLVVFFASNVLL